MTGTEERRIDDGATEATSEATGDVRTEGRLPTPMKTALRWLVLDRTLPKPAALLALTALVALLSGCGGDGGGGGVY